MLGNPQPHFPSTFQHGMNTSIGMKTGSGSATEASQVDQHGPSSGGVEGELIVTFSASQFLDSARISLRHE